MRIVDSYPLITTAAMSACRDFYIQHFGFNIGFEASWFVWLQRNADAGESSISLAFMTPDHPTAPPDARSFSGAGMLLTFQVEDAANAFAELQASGAPIVHPLTREAWGQLRCTVQDPAGTLIDICEQVDSAPGYWDTYAGALA